MYSSLINSINFVKVLKNLKVPNIILSKQHTQQAQLNIYVACLLFLLIAGSNTAKMQKVLTKSNSFKLDAKILLQLLYSNLFFARSYILFLSIEITICLTRK